MSTIVEVADSFSIYIRKIKVIVIKYMIYVKDNKWLISRLLVLMVLVLFALFSEPAYFEASSVQPDCFIASVAPLCGAHMVCSQGPKVGVETLWTPVILLNSPYQGSSTGQITTTTQTSIQIVSRDPSYGGALIESSTTNSLSNQINETNGSAGGVFELDKWTIYQAVTIWVGGD
ncbi:MAG: hypothetical protein QXE12_02955 [Conexivisphaerales archaeon]